MGRFWRSESDGPNPSSSSWRCSTRRLMKSDCKTEKVELEPAKYIRKCQKTKEIFKYCPGRPDEVVESKKEYTEDDVTDQVLKGSIDPRMHETHKAEYHLNGVFGHLVEAALQIKDRYFNAQPEAVFKPNDFESGQIDHSGQARDV